MSINYDKLPPDWQKLVMQEYEEGASDVEVRSTLRMTKGMWEALYNDSVTTSFKEVVDFGRGLAKAWWMRQARQGLKLKGFNANLWYMVMKNQFGWSDKTTTMTKDSPDLTEDELNQQLEAAFAKFNKTQKG